MELRHYLRIIQRSWPLVVGLPVLVALLTLALALLLPQRYVITTAVMVTQRPIASGATPQTILPDQNNLNSWAASEYVDDDILQLVATRRFADDIAAWLQSNYKLRLDPERINKGLKAERKHRTIYVQVTADLPDQARLIAQGAVAMFAQKGLEYWGRADTTRLAVSLVDMPDKAKPARGLVRLAVDVFLRTLLALLLGIGLAFLRHYLDLSLRTRGDVEALGFNLLAAVPLDGTRRAGL